jgi:nucleoside-diphosphate-sugar epimerase
MRLCVSRPVIETCAQGGPPTLRPPGAHKLAALSATTRTVKRRAAITGASGYLGRNVAARLLAEDWEVVGLGRRPSGFPGIGHVPFQLGDSVAPDRLAAVDVLVHCAWDFQQKTWADINAVNVQGTGRLFESASAAGVERLVHISTVSASGAPRSMYGRAKLLTEKMAEERGVVVVRPGLLYGPDPGGMVGMLTKLVRGLPAVPVLVGSDRPLFLAHQDDVSALIRLVVDGSEGTHGSPLVAAAEDPHSLRDVLGAIAAAEGRRRFFFRVPWRAVYIALRSIELTRLPLPMRADSALSIATLDPDPFASGSGPQTMSFRSFEPSALRLDPEPKAATSP